MNILVCIKQILDSESEIAIGDSGVDAEKWSRHSGSARYELNPFDAYALEEAVRIKERFQDVRIDAVTVGPESTVDVLRRALGMGADEGIHMLDRMQGYRPPSLTASWIASFAAGRSYDLIFTGIMSADEANGQTGPMIAHMLCLPCATAVIREQLAPDGTAIFIEREIEGGVRDMFEIKLPCVLTIQSGINTPRYPALSKVLRAKKKRFETIQTAAFKRVSRQLSLLAVRYPQKTGKGMVLEGAPEEKASALLDILDQKALLR